MKYVLLVLCVFSFYSSKSQETENCDSLKVAANNLLMDADADLNACKFESAESKLAILDSLSNYSSCLNSNFLDKLFPIMEKSISFKRDYNISQRLRKEVETNLINGICSNASSSLDQLAKYKLCNQEAINIFIEDSRGKIRTCFSHKSNNEKISETLNLLKKNDYSFGQVDLFRSNIKQASEGLKEIKLFTPRESYLSIVEDLESVLSVRRAEFLVFQTKDKINTVSNLSKITNYGNAALGELAVNKFADNIEQIEIGLLEIMKFENRKNYEFEVKAIESNLNQRKQEYALALTQNRLAKLRTLAEKTDYGSLKPGYFKERTYEKNLNFLRAELPKIKSILNIEEFSTEVNQIEKLIKQREEEFETSLKAVKKYVRKDQSKDYDKVFKPEFLFALYKANLDIKDVNGKKFINSETEEGNFEVGLNWRLFKKGNYLQGNDGNGIFGHGLLVKYGQRNYNLQDSTFNTNESLKVRYLNPEYRIYWSGNRNFHPYGSIGFGYLQPIVVTYINEQEKVSSGFFKKSDYLSGHLYTVLSIGLSFQRYTYGITIDAFAQVKPFGLTNVMAHENFSYSNNYSEPILSEFGTLGIAISFRPY